MQKRNAIVLAVPFLFVAGAPAPAVAEDLFALFGASIHDEPRDGLGDSFNDPPFEGLIRLQSTREDRAVLEYQTAHLVGERLGRVAITGVIHNNNAGGQWPRIFDVVVYPADGTPHLDDFSAAGEVVAQLTWEDPSQPLEFHVCAREAIAPLVFNGAEFIGVRVQGVSDELFPSSIDGGTYLTLEVLGECPIDFTGSTDPNDPDYGVPDGVLDVKDFFFYLDAFATNNFDVCDLNGCGSCDVMDFFIFLDLFVQGCD